MEQDGGVEQWNDFVMRAKARSSSRQPVDGMEVDETCMLKNGDCLWEIGCKVGTFSIFMVYTEQSLDWV